MALIPGGKAAEVLSQSELQLSQNVFAEIIRSRAIPDSFTPHNVDEIGIGGHKSVVKEVLARFGRYGNFSTEYNATSLPLVDQARIKSRYKKVLDWRNQANIGDYGMKKHYPVVMQRLNKAPLNYSSRLHCLVMAHTPEWENEKAPKWDENSQAVYIFMSDMIGPMLKYNYKPDSANTPGDYNLMVAWAFKNVDTIKKLYLDKDDPKYIDTQLARGNGVVLNISAFENLIGVLKSTVTSTPAETTSKDKTLQSNVEQVVAPPTTIVRDFERWFVQPRQREGLAGMGDLLSVDIMSAMGEEGARRYFDRLNFLSLLNLAILQDIPGKNEPLKRLDVKLGFGGKLPEILREYLTVVSLAQDEGSQGEEVMNSLVPMRPEWGNRSLAIAITDIAAEMSEAEYLGYGSGRALLVQYNEEVRIKGSREAKMVQYMGMMVKLATGDGRLGLERYTTGITD